MHKVYLSLGGNIGDKYKNFRLSYQLINTEIGEIIQYSSVYESPPWGFESKDMFWNQVIIANTILTPAEVLAKVKFIEAKLGRPPRKGVYTSRIIDIDILYYGNIYIEEEGLVIPHPLLHERKFVLVPLVEVAPLYIHPLLRFNNFQMLENCHDNSIIKKLSINLL